MSGTPRVLCHGKTEAKNLEEILTRIQKGEPIKSFVRAGSTVYIHFGGD